MGKAQFIQCCWENWVTLRKRMITYFHNTQNQFKWIKDLNPKTIILIEENTGGYLDVALSNNFGFDIKSTSTKEKSRTTSNENTFVQQKKQSQNEEAIYRTGESICKPHI